MKRGGKHGASTKTGLRFEEDTNILDVFRSIGGYNVVIVPATKEAEIYYKNKLVARCFPKHSFYRFLEKEGVQWKALISKKLLPDNAVLVVVRETLFIIEVKFQKVAGSVDEKLQTCDFKRKQYTKLVHNLGLKVEYVYVLNDWFEKPEYKDVLDYIHSVGCHYKFKDIPLAWLGLPAPKA